MKELKKAPIAVLVLASLVLLVGCAPAPPGPGAPMPPEMTFFCLLPLVILLIIALIAALIIYIVRNKPSLPPVAPGEIGKKDVGGGMTGKSFPDLPAEEIVRRRYASGEITYEEFQQIIRNLRSAERGDTT